METQLRHSLKNGSTCLRGRLKLSTPSDTVSRTYVNVNTTTSRIDIEGYLRQFWCCLGRKHGPVDNRLRLGLGAHYTLGSGLKVRSIPSMLTGHACSGCLDSIERVQEKLFLGPVVKKELHFQPRNADQALSANFACICEWDAASMKVWCY